MKLKTSFRTIKYLIEIIFYPKLKFSKKYWTKPKIKNNHKKYQIYLLYTN